MKMMLVPFVQHTEYAAIIELFKIYSCSYNNRENNINIKSLFEKKYKYSFYLFSFL